MAWAKMLCPNERDNFFSFSFFKIVFVDVQDITFAIFFQCIGKTRAVDFIQP